MTEHGQEWYFKTSPGEELLAVGKKLRSYITSEKVTVPDLFIKMFAGGRPITAEEYNALTAVRMENTGKIRGVFDVNFDKREFSAVHIMDGWQTWAMRDVSVAVYHATRSQFSSGDDKWRKLLNHLKDVYKRQAEAYAYLIRRLTPLECERLQGFPDGWTDIPDASDSARYKALGNSVAIPCVEFIMGRIAAALRAV